MFSNKLWLSEPFTKAQAWVDLFANANHTAGSFWVRGNEVNILRGQLGWSELTMAQRWGWSRDKVRRFLKWLENESNIRQQKTSLTTIITIVNYDIYQSDKTTDHTAERQQKDSRRYTNKNDKKVKNDKNTINTGEETSQDDKKPQFTPEGAEVIKALEEVDPKNKTYYANKTQRASADFLVNEYGLEKVLKVIKLLPKSNNLDFCPIITSPYELKEKWGKLATQLQKIKNNQLLLI